MNILKIRDEKKEYGYLYYEKIDQKGYVFLSSDDFWGMPMLLDHYIHAPYGFIGSKDTLKWVSSRILPIDRQNISDVLKENHFREYNEFGLLFLNHGICPQDDCYLEKMEEDDLTEEILNRISMRMTDFIPLSCNSALAVFGNGKVKRVDMASILKMYPGMNQALADKDYMDFFYLDASGFELCISDVYSIPFHVLYDNGTDTGISEPELAFFERKNLISTKDATEILGCTRQNLDALVKKGILHPLYDFNRIRIFKRSEIKMYLSRK